ncbi:hypothetical protein NDU88_001740 [Pleurodeles waltl]|uniref:Uncharacterized protein n=1 Tax=Pleurodeles waltl TaxID=8319 RepID=A0AAV7M916_PLEWA|nr:hypothetical protein NDU88_001740 [Pleurodeles waltl]
MQRRCDRGRRCGLTHTGGPVFVPLPARIGGREACSESLPANTLCRERERLRRPDRRLVRAAAFADITALVGLVALWIL